jgi:hypothetical protein
MRKLIIALLMTAVAGCKSATTPDVVHIPAGASTTTTVEQPATTTTTLKQEQTEAVKPLSWKKPEWDKFLLNSVDEYWAKLSKAKDMATVCPKYGTLNEAKKKIAYAELLVAMAYYESGWKPTAWMIEPGMGLDPITKKQVKSEGLLQLSYQDTQWAKHCKFDWSKDKLLKQDDPKKTIFDPLLNLNCGVGILARQVDRKGNVFLSSGVYWSVIKIGGKYTKIPKIKSRVLAAVKECS